MILHRLFNSGISIVLLGLMVIYTQSCCNNKYPYEIAAVTVRFEGLNDSDLSRAWVIETERNNPDTQVDSIFYGYLNQTNKYSFLLEFDRSRPNGDYFIYADSVSAQNVITDVEVIVEEHKCKADIVNYTYRFNGTQKSEQDREIVIIR